jgi:hypothetical protein
MRTAKVVEFSTATQLGQGHRDLTTVVTFSTVNVTSMSINSLADCASCRCAAQLNCCTQHETHSLQPACLPLLCLQAVMTILMIMMTPETIQFTFDQGLAAAVPCLVANPRIVAKSLIEPEDHG